MAEFIEPQEDSQAKCRTASELLTDFAVWLAKDTLNQAVEDPINGLIRLYNYGTGSNLPTLDITGMNDKPKGPLNYIKADSHIK